MELGCCPLDTKVCTECQPLMQTMRNIVNDSTVCVRMTSYIVLVLDKGCRHLSVLKSIVKMWSAWFQWRSDYLLFAVACAELTNYGFMYKAVLHYLYIFFIVLGLIGQLWPYSTGVHVVNSWYDIYAMSHEPERVFLLIPDTRLYAVVPKQQMRWHHRRHQCANRQSQMLRACSVFASHTVHSSGTASTTPDTFLILA